jgi:hypothetical protein
VRSFAHAVAVRPQHHAPGGAPELAFVHALEARPRRTGFNLGVVIEGLPEGPWTGGTGLRLFYGRVTDLDPSGDVWVELGEAPSGRALDACLPAAWFEGRDVRAGLPLELITWTDAAGADQRRVRLLAGLDER